MTPDALATYVDHISPDATLLGRIAWFSVFDTTVAWADLVTFMAAAGIDACYAPKAPADVDVWRRVTTAAQSKRNENADGTYCNVLVRDVANDDYKVLRRLVIETVDSTGHRLSYQETYDLVFDKLTNAMHANKLVSGPTVADQIVFDAIASYSARRGTVNAEAIRTLIGRVFTAANATGLRPTGAVYFTPIAESHWVSKLERLAAYLPTTTVHSLPLVDEDGRQADMVRDAVVDESVVELDAMLAEGKAMLSGTVSPRRAATMLARGKQLRSKAVAYSELLDDSLSLMHARLELFDAQMMALISEATE